MADQLDLPLDVTKSKSHPNLCIYREFIERCKNTRGLSPNTCRAYEYDLRDFLRQIDPQLGLPEISKEHVLEYVRRLRERALRETTVKRRVATLKILFAWLETEAIVQTSVFHRLDLSIRPPKRLPRALETREMQFLLKLCETEADRTMERCSFEQRLLYVAVLIMFSTGLRVSELVSLSLNDASMNESSFLVRGKGNKERRVYLSSRRAVKAVNRFLAERLEVSKVGPFFVNSHGKPLSTQWIRKRLAEIATRAGVTRRVTPHMLRHTAATQLLEAGVDIRFVQKLLGHSSIATTQIYTQVSDRSLRDQLQRADTLRRVRRAV